VPLPNEPVLGYHLPSKLNALDLAFKLMRVYNIEPAESIHLNQLFVQFAYLQMLDWLTTVAFLLNGFDRRACGDPAHYRNGDLLSIISRIATRARLAEIAFDDAGRETSRTRRGGG